MSFYVTLPSDGCMDIYPNNTLSNFLTKLARPIELSGEWEVGLVELIYPRMWNNVSNGLNKYEISLGTGVKKTGHIEPGFYESPTDILNALPKQIQVKPFHNKHTKKVHVQLTNGATIKFSKGLAENLGFVADEVIGENILPGKTETVISPFMADPHSDLYLLYVYSDIIQSEMVGGTLAQLLRIIAVTGKDGEMVLASYDRPHYCPLSRRNFQSIEVNIRTHTGRLVSFVNGRVIVKLHFRLRHL